MSKSKASPTDATLDHILCAQLIVAWAGENERLRWWRTDLVSEFGGEDLFQTLLPNTWRWAVFEGAREVARRTDAALRDKAHDPDQITTLFRFGSEIDERLDERLRDLKGMSKEPREVWPVLSEIATPEWDKAAFAAFIGSRPAPDTVIEPAGRRIKGAMPDALEQRVDQLLGALAPLGGEYSMPHYRRTR